jgi:hypothetical protein
MKTKLFHLTIHYVLCKASFHMATNIISCTYKVMPDPSLCFSTCHHVSNFVRVIYTINLQRIFDILRHSWAFLLVLNSTTHQSTSYLDLCIRVNVEEHHTIANLQGCVLPMF